MEPGKLMVYNADRDEFISINPHTDCYRCGKTVDSTAAGTGLVDFRICPNHCAGCQTFSPLPNRVHEWTNDRGEKFQAPGCGECRPTPTPFLEGFITKLSAPRDEVDY